MTRSHADLWAHTPVRFVHDDQDSQGDDLRPDYKVTLYETPLTDSVVVYDADSSPFTLCPPLRPLGSLRCLVLRSLSTRRRGEEVIIAIDYTAPSASKVEIDENVNPRRFVSSSCVM